MGTTNIPIIMPYPLKRASDKMILAQNMVFFINHSFFCYSCQCYQDIKQTGQQDWDQMWYVD